MVFLITRLWVGLDITFDESPQILIKNVDVLHNRYVLLNQLYIQKPRSGLFPPNVALSNCLKMWLYQILLKKVNKVLSSFA